ncbi:hypothetical protein E0L17_00490 [Olsenella sp. SW781]|nr:hypothetical protein [Olsenella sp. SW781]
MRGTSSRERACDGRGRLGRRDPRARLAARLARPRRLRLCGRARARRPARGGAPPRPPARGGEGARGGRAARRRHRRAP